MAEHKWTVEALKDHIDALFAERDKQVAAALVSNNRRLDTMNEFRAQLDAQTKEFITRAMADVHFNQLDNKTALIDSTLARMDALLVERDKAVTAALTANDKRLDTMNEFRHAMEDQQKTYITKGEYGIRQDQFMARGDSQEARLNEQARTALPRDEFDARHDEITRRITTLETRVAEQGGITLARQRSVALYISVASVLAAASAGLIVFLHH